MGNINTSYFDRKRYTLKSKVLGSLIITEPIGWNDDEKEYARHENYHGIIAKFSNSLKFIGSGAEYIQTVFDIYDINEEIELISDEKHPKTDEWINIYSGFLDLSTYTKEKNQVSVKFNSGGLEQLLKSRESEKIEIDRTTTIDGKVIPSINTIDVELEARRIFLKSKLEVKEENQAYLSIGSSNSNTRNQSCGISLVVIENSHENLHSVIPQTLGTESNGQTGMMFLAVADRRMILDISINVNYIYHMNENNLAWARHNLSLTKYGGGTDYNFIQRNDLVYLDFDMDNAGGSTLHFYNGSVLNGTFNGQIILEQGESLALESFCKASFRSGGGHLHILAQQIYAYVSIEESSTFEKTNSKAILQHELFESIVTITTNKEKAFYSELLGRTDLGYSVDGNASLLACTHGFWIRGFDKLPIPAQGPPKVENLFKPLTTSFKDAYSSLDAIMCVGIGIEKVGNLERVRLEELSYFFNLNTLIKLPNQVKNVKRTVATEKYYSGLEFGPELGGDYQEACGLDEFNTKSTYTSIINRLKNTYTKISKFRYDMYGLEFTRRKQKSQNSTKDNERDNHIWFIDLKRYIPTLFKMRLWQDDFDNAPTGIFSPETASNLRLSPINCMFRHSWWFAGCLRKYPLDYVRYGSSVANSQLKTKLSLASGGNGKEYIENGNIINTDFQSPRFIPLEIEFEHICDFDVMQQINGKTMILGKEIPNIYGMIEFINEYNEVERGFLMNLKPNGNGKFKVLKANR